MPETEPSSPDAVSTAAAVTIRRCLATILCVAAIVMGATGVSRSIRMVGNSWVSQDVQRQLVVAAVLLPAFIACGVFSVSAWLICCGRRPSPGRTSLWSNLAVLLALYVPFFWAVSTTWQLQVPVLPGFTAGVFTRPLDSESAFIAASGTCTILLLYSLFTIRDRLCHGFSLAVGTALVISLASSYAAYSFMSA